MQLPSEVRLIILGLLLVRTTSISSQEYYESEHPTEVVLWEETRKRDYHGRPIKRIQPFVQPFVRYVKGYRLTPSVIRTCQQISDEALPLLYYHNTLQVDINTDDSIRCAMFESIPFWLDGTFSTHSRNAKVKIFDNISVFYGEFARIRGELVHNWIQNHSLNETVHRCRKSMVNFHIYPYIRALAQLRLMLRAIAPFLLAKEVEVTILSYPTGLTTPPDPEKSQLHLLRSYQTLRCSKFQFTNSSDSSAISVQGFINGNTSIIDLEPFMRRPARMTDRLKYMQALPTLQLTFIEAIENFDVLSFLQTRFDILRNWQSFVQRCEMRKLSLVRYENGTASDHAVHGALPPPRYDELRECHVVNSAELGLEIQEMEKI